jgi:acyl-coenzyme A thioesterase PaaI-like protein
MRHRTALLSGDLGSGDDHLPDHRALLELIRSGGEDPPDVVTKLSMPGITTWAEGQVETELHIEDVMFGPQGCCPSYLAVIADTMANHVGLTLLRDDEWMATRRLEVDYVSALRTVDAGAVARASRTGDHLDVDVEVRDARGTVACRASALLLVGRGWAPDAAAQPSGAPG